MIDNTPDTIDSTRDFIVYDNVQLSIFLPSTVIGGQGGLNQLPVVWVAGGMDRAHLAAC